MLNESYEDADRFTSSKLRELAGEKAVKRGYVYFSEVESIPSIDLITLDKLWVVYSRGKFGFTVQSKILDSLGGRYDRLWPRIGWKQDGIWTRYPKAFNWSIEAPNGHMPLVNQLRGNAGNRQVPGVKLGLQHNLGLGGACVVTLYESSS